MDATGICSGSTARLRFQEWVAAGVTEAAGVPVALAVDGANRHDMKLVRFTVDSMAMDRPAPSPEHPQGLCLDKGYDFAEARLGGIRLHRPHTQSGRGGSGHQGGGRFKARRWVVEGTHNWLNRFRRILVRWDKSPENCTAFLHFACALITLRAAGLLG